MGEANFESDDREGNRDDPEDYDDEPQPNAIGLDLSTLVQPLAIVEDELGVVEDFLTPRRETPIKKGGAKSKAAFFEQWQTAALELDD